MSKITTFVSATLLATATLAASAILRESPTPAPQRARQTLSAELLRKSRTVTENTDNRLGEISHRVATPRRVTQRAGINKEAARAAAKASDLQGYVIYAEAPADPGWYQMAWPKHEMLWKRPTNFSPSCGFIRDGKLYAFYSLSSQYGGVIDAGLMIQDPTTGAILESYPYDIFDSYENVVYCAAYDPATDLAWVITSNKEGTGYILQKYSPKLNSFSNSGVSVPTDWLDFAWNPADSSLYMLDESGYLKKYDTKSKKFIQVLHYSYDMTDYPNDMVYSPKDEAFFAILDSYDSQDNPCSDAVLLKLNGEVSYLGTIQGNPQYSIIHIPDAYVNPSAPAAPTFKSWDVAGAATEGKLNITLPKTAENGETLTGTVYTQLTEDGDAMDSSTTAHGAPGSDVAITIKSTEGLHTYTVTPYVLTDDGYLYGTPLQLNRYFGNDTPAPTAKVTLSATEVTWTAVTKGANNGYIDAANVTYDVYLDGTKVNTTPVKDTKLAVSIPANGQLGHQASVVANCNGKSSEPTLSAKYYADGPLSLPVSIAPAEGATDLDAKVISMFTIVKDPKNTETLRGWRYDDQQEHTGGFYCLAPKVSSKGDYSDEWLFLPAINFGDKDAHYKFTMDVWTANHYFTSPETYEVAISRTPDGKDATIIREATTVEKKPNFELSETLFTVPEAGTWYIGIHYISPLDSYRLYARNFCVEEAMASATSPDAVSALSAEAGEDGALKATLTMTLPTLDISGNPLAAGTVITAKAVSEAAEASVEGAPGEEVHLDIATVQGDNIIRVSTSTADGKGRTAEVTVYTGVYRPGEVKYDNVVSDDNQKLTVNVTIPKLNEDKEYVGPDDCDVLIYRRVGDEWRLAANIGKSRSWTFDCPAPTHQELYLFGVTAKNCVGESEIMTNFGMHLGKLFTLPMVEKFTSDKNDNVNITYEPLSTENVSYLPGTWGFCDPADVDDAAANATSTAIFATYESETQLLLPRFSTLGAHNAKLALSLFFGNKSPQAVTVFVSSQETEMMPVAEFVPSDGHGWEEKLISLPSECQNKPWVQITIRATIQGYSQYFLMDGYSIADYPAEMVTLTGIRGRSRGTIGDTLDYEVSVLNAGTAPTDMPKYSFVVLGDDHIAAELTDKDAPTTLAAGATATLRFEFTPRRADMGDLLARCTIEGQPAQSVTEIEKQITIVNAPVPTVSDLEIKTLGEKEVSLVWSKPAFVDGFEALEPWAYGNPIGAYGNIDLDGGNVWGISELSYDGKMFPKAYQVFSTAITDNKLLEAYAGEQYLLCMSASRTASDDWLVSPEVKPGSEISFVVKTLDPGFPEHLEVMAASTTDFNDFKVIDGGELTLTKTAWDTYTFTLPADARYFALHHVGDDGQSQFGFLLDNLSYEPAVELYPVLGYNVYRNETCVASKVQACNFTDSGVDTTLPVRYSVKTISKIGDEEVESDRSNVVWTNSSAVEDVAVDGRRVMVAGSEIVLGGFVAGSKYAVYNTAGVKVAQGETGVHDTHIALVGGVYTVVCDGLHVKVALR